MKKTLIALSLAAAIPVAAYAAMGGHGWHDRGSRLERMAEHLDLDDSQKDRLEALFAEHRVEIRALREQLRVQMREILTDEQMSRLDELRSRRKARRGRHHYHSSADDSSSDDSSDDSR